MSTASIQTSEVPQNTKNLVHSISILLLPALFLIGLAASYAASGEFNFATFFGMVLGILLLAGYVAFLYYLVGGFDWRAEKISTIRSLLFFILSGIIYGLILYGFWYLVRWIVAKSSKLPMAALKGMLLTR